MQWNKYLNRRIECECGKQHSCDIEQIIIESAAIQKLPKLLAEKNFKKICLVSDSIAWTIAGAKIEQLLGKANLVCNILCFSENIVLPNEESVAQLEREIGQDCDVMVAIGSGTINDICKYYAYQKEIPYYIVATAPSMDGYASNVAAMLFQNTKVTVEAARPRVILADTDILCEAPTHMIAAGVGDMLGKYVCLADWVMAHLISGEYYCEFVQGIMKEALEKIAQCIPSLAKRDKQAIEKLTEGLVLSGIAMSYLGNSRPASGSEHHLSHFWEMMFLQQGKEAVLHGTKVGVGTVVGLYLYHALPKYLLESKIPTPIYNDQKEWEEEIQKAYGICAKQVVAIEMEVEKNKKETVQERNKLLWQQKEKILCLIEKLPSVTTIILDLKLLGAPFLPSHIRVERDMTENAIRYAKDLRNRYGILQLYYDIGKQVEVISDFNKMVE